MVGYAFMSIHIIRCVISTLLCSVVPGTAFAQMALFRHVIGDAAQRTARLQVDSNVVAHLRSVRPAKLDLVLPGVGVQHVTRTQLFTQPQSEFVTYASASADAFTTVVVGPSATLVTTVQGASITTIGPARDGNGYAVVTVPLAGGASCGTHEANVHSAVLAAMHAGKVADRAMSTLDTLTLRVAVEIDPSVVLATGSSAALAATYATSLMAVVGQIFERDIAMRLRITSMRVADSDTTPYPRFGSVFSYIDSAVRYAERALTHVERDLMVFLVARGAAGGIAASIGGLCQPTFSYCAADINGTSVMDLPTWSWDASVVAHEIGHVLGAVHTQSCLWPGGPLDSCVQSESGTCVSFLQTRPTIGTIMSYCHQRRSQGGEVVMAFHPRHQRVMRAMAEAAACVGNRLPERSNVVVGQVHLRDSDTVVPGVRLTISPWNFSYVRGTPATSGNDVALSDANGMYAFTGLGHGLYSIRLPSTYNAWPLTLDAAQEIAPVIVSADTAMWPLRVSPATPVLITVEGLPRFEGVRFHVVHRNTGLPFYASTIAYTDEQRDAGIMLDRGLPAGEYAFVPVARGYRFEPSIVRLNVRAGGDTIRLAVRAERVDTAGVHCTVVAVTFNDDGTSSTVPNQEIDLRVGEGADLFADQLVTNDVGVATILLDSSTVRRTLRARWDTTAWVDATPPDVLVNLNGSFLYYVNRRRRSEPLIIRPRQFEVAVQPYASLSDDAVVFRPSGTTSGYQGHRLLPPFPIRFRDKVVDSTWAYINGFLTGGPSPVYDGEGRSVTSYEPVGLVLSPFGTRLAYVRDSTRTSTLRARVVGEAPRRWWELEWNNMGLEYFDTNRRFVIGGTATFTMRVQEATGTVEMHYGTVTIPESVSLNVEVGIRGADNFDRLLVEPRDVTVPSWRDVHVTTGYVEGRPSLLATSNVAPIPGRLYRFTDPLTSAIDERRLAPARYRVDGRHLYIDDLVGPGHLTLFDVAGRVAGSQSFVDGVVAFNMETLAPGIYVVWWQGRASAFAQPIVIGR